MAFEINKELVLSTAHIPKSEADQLAQLPNDLGAFHNYEYGYRIVNDYELHPSDFNSETIKDNLPVTYGLILLAKDMGCKWLVLDRDADIVDSLPSWEW